MSTPWHDLRPQGAPSEDTIVAYVGGEATAEERAEIEARCAADPSFAAQIAERQAGFAALPSANSQALFARIQQGVDAQEPSAPKRAAPRRTGWRWLKIGGPLLVGAAAATVFWVRTESVTAPKADDIRSKGSVGLRVARARDARTETVLSGSTFAAGDQLRFAPEPKPVEGHVLVVGVERSGTLYGLPHRQSTPVSGLDADGFIPGAATLDGSKGEEFFYLVVCPQAFGISALAVTQTGRLKAPAGCRVADYLVRKP